MIDSVSVLNLESGTAILIDAVKIPKIMIIKISSIIENALLFRIFTAFVKCA